ncbi:MAG: OB-fold nucleic acid binding domain-containing protein [Odoribacteraceae bacterium]|jgi:hypothetical protein|nr:OB-fold nucleic acid binding domain-containing protein [Odoribacteraceae bacterium]
MKTMLLMMALLLGMASCGNKGKQAPTGDTTRATTTAVAAAYELDSLLLVADNLVDKSVSVRGFVTHTCKHSGKRCFIVGKDGKTSFRVEATGEIGGFNRELVGSEIEVKGVVKERRLTAEFIDRHEKEVNEQQATDEDGSAESCAAELENIQQMRAWMKEHDKGYYSIYYMDGESYEVVENE